MPPSFYRYERSLWKKGCLLVAGVDEAGRGPLAGPVVAAAVLFACGDRIKGVDDSKKLTPDVREKLFCAITDKALSVGVGIVPHTVIDEINILQATMRAMGEAVAALSPAPEHLLIDGNYYRNEGFPFTTIVGGDGLSFSIAAASIIAKVTRDRIMTEYHERFPVYGFAKHKGYCTKEHLDALRRFGPCEIHRKSFHVHSIESCETADIFEQAE